jgi:hypothetical protein
MVMCLLRGICVKHSVLFQISVHMMNFACFGNKEYMMVNLFTICFEFCWSFCVVQWNCAFMCYKFCSKSPWWCTGGNYRKLVIGKVFI